MSCKKRAWLFSLRMTALFYLDCYGSTSLSLRLLCLGFFLHSRLFADGLCLDYPPSNLRSWLLSISCTKSQAHPWLTSAFQTGLSDALVCTCCISSCLIIPQMVDDNEDFVTYITILLVNLLQSFLLPSPPIPPTRISHRCMAVNNLEDLFFRAVRQADLAIRGQIVQDDLSIVNPWYQE